MIRINNTFIVPAKDYMSTKLDNFHDFTKVKRWTTPKQNMHTIDLDTEKKHIPCFNTQAEYIYPKSHHFITNLFYIKFYWKQQLVYFNQNIQSQHAINEEPLSTYCWSSGHQTLTRAPTRLSSYFLVLDSWDNSQKISNQT